MLKTRSFAWILAVAVVSTVLGPSRAEAQACLICSEVKVGNSRGHIATNNDAHGIHARRGGPHPDKMWPGNCDEKHPIACAPEEGGGPGLYAQSGGVLDAVLAAVSAGDALEAYRIVLGQPKESPVHFVPERTAIQVRGCGEHVIAHIPLAHLATAEFLAVVEAGQRTRTRLALGPPGPSTSRP